MIRDAGYAQKLSERPQDQPEFQLIVDRLAHQTRRARRVPFWWGRARRREAALAWKGDMAVFAGHAYELGRRFTLPDTVPVRFIIVATEDEYGPCVLASPTVDEADFTRQVTGWLHGKEQPLLGPGGEPFIRGPKIPVDRIVVRAACRDFTVLRGPIPEVMKELWRKISPDGR